MVADITGPVFREAEGTAEVYPAPPRDMPAPRVTRAGLVIARADRTSTDRTSADRTSTDPKRQFLRYKGGFRVALFTLAQKFALPPIAPDKLSGDVSFWMVCYWLCR